MHTVRDTALIYRRQLQLSLRNPLWVLFGLAQPALYLVLFGPLLTGLVGRPGFPSGNAWQIYTPGLLVQLCLFGSAFVGFALIADWRAGVLERLRVTPVSRAAPLLGRLLRDVTVTSVQALILIGTAFALGLRVSVAAIAVAMAFVVAIVVAVSALSYTLAMTTRNEDSFAQVINLLTVLLLLLSGILLPMALAPRWLANISALSPLRYMVDAVRDAFTGHLLTPTVMLGVGLAVLFAAGAVGIGCYTFTREDR
ncbi:ABC transporter permease [Catenuloplanes indicus]|uniref:Transport permease protein n=1 Tax=Catenuloplanes indicus TaxID=137267 RepID=A0AAE3VWP6_9ACTN|nr:ABC transporter permease [Catenuloplanes indicus]MDQ0364992.1 ABC-2 type transport system permease protein [Catenuloplanes indicus]